MVICVTGWNYVILINMISFLCTAIWPLSHFENVIILFMSIGPQGNVLNSKEKHSSYPGICRYMLLIYYPCCVQVHVCLEKPGKSRSVPVLLCCTTTRQDQSRPDQRTRF